MILEETKSLHILGSRVKSYLQSGRLNDAILLLRKSAKGNSPLLSKLEQIESTYSLLLKYFLDGAPDSQRFEMLRGLKLQLKAIADHLDRLRLIPEHPSAYYATARILSFRPRNLESLFAKYDDLNEKVMLKNELGAPDLKEMKAREEIQDTIFNYLWTLGPDATADLKLVRDKSLTAENSDFLLSAQMVSALLLALTEWYDREKLLTLISIYEASSTDRLAARALAALIIALGMHNERVEDDAPLICRLEKLKESLIASRRIKETVRAVVRTRDTDRVVSKMRTEVLPGMMKLGPDILRKMKEATEENGLEGLEENPEWEEMMSKTGLADRLRELTDMQLEGADVMMVAFSNLKGFPFFSRISNWMLPFTTDLSHAYEAGVADTVGRGSALERMLQRDGVMCDSDKFSFLFALGSMPEGRRKMMSEQLELQSAQLEEAKNAAAVPAERSVFELETEKYIRDLYRFFKLYPKSGEFHDPFADPMDFQRLPVVASVISEPGFLELVAEFYFRRGYFKEAVPMLDILSGIHPSDPHIWEKLGVSMEMQIPKEETGDEYRKACDEVLACYMKAELLSPDSLWLAKRIGRAYARAGKWKLAVEYLTRATGDSESVNDLLELAAALEKGNDAPAALKVYHKANYLRPGIGNVRRGIARLEAEGGDLDKALRYALAEGHEEPDAEGWLLLGNIRFLRREFREAMEAYRHLIQPEHKHREWKKQIMATWHWLEERGASLPELQLLLDRLSV